MTLKFQKTILTLANLAFALSNYIMHILLARFSLSTEEYGRYSLIIYVLNNTIILLAAGAPVLIAIYSQAENQRKIFNFIVRIQLIVAVFLTCSFLLSSIWIRQWIDNSDLEDVWIWFSLIFIPFGTYAFLSLFANAKKQYIHSSIAIGIFLLTRFTLTFALIQSQGLKSIPIAFSAGAVLASLYLMFVLRSELRNIGLFDTEKLVSKQKLIIESSTLVVIAFLQNFILNFDLFTLSHRGITETDLGTYASFITLANVPIYLATAATSFIWPELNQLKNQNLKVKYFLEILASFASISLIYGIIMLIAYTRIVKLLLDKSLGISSNVIILYTVFLSGFIVLYFSIQFLNSISKKYYSLGIFATFGMTYILLALATRIFSVEISESLVTQQLVLIAITYLITVAVTLLFIFRNFVYETRLQLLSKK